MTTTQKTTRNVKPRVLAAILRLQTFTAQEIVAAAELEDRKQAYAQLRPLETAKLISSVPLPEPELDHRPTKLYRISDEGDASRKLAEQLAEYGFPAAHGDEESRNAAVERGSRVLNTVERFLSAFDPTKMDENRELARAEDKIQEWTNQLNLVGIELETATLESEGIPNSDQVLGTLSLRLRETRNSIQRLSHVIRRRRDILWIRTLVENWNDTIPDPVHWARKLLKGTQEAEVVLDFLSPGLHKLELLPAWLTSQAIRTNDVELMQTCFSHLWKDESKWNRYNHASVHFLRGDFKEAYERWLEVYRDLAEQGTPLKPDYALGIFICEPKNLSQSTLRPLLRKYEVSIVSPRTLDFWNMDEEIVRPLFVDPIAAACQNAGPIPNTLTITTDENFSGPLWALFAYGPLTAIIRQWPGAPALRVAASVDKLTHAELDTVKIANALRHEKCVVILEKHGMRDPQGLSEDLETALGQVEMIVSIGASTEPAY